MQRRTWITLAALVLAGPMVTWVRADDMQKPALDSDRAAPGASIRDSDAGNAGEPRDARTDKAKLTAQQQAQIRDTLRAATEAGIRKDGYKDLVDCLSQIHKDHITKWSKDQKFDDLNAVVAQINADWQNKYHQPFAIADAQKLYSGDKFVIISGQMGTEAQPASERQEGEKDKTAKPGEGYGTSSVAKPNQPIDQDKSAVASDRRTGSSDRPTDAETPKYVGDEPVHADVSPIGKTASVMIISDHGLPQVTVPLIEEGMAWKIDAPSTLDGATLKSNLVTQLSALRDQKENWPADVNDACRLVSHRVLLAVVNTPATPDQPMMDKAASD